MARVYISPAPSKYLEVKPIKAKLLLLVVLLAFVSVAMAQPTGLVSNILQGQAQVTPSQPVILGGAGGKPPQMMSLTTTAGTQTLININVTNPNPYQVTTSGLYINFTEPNGATATSGSDVNLSNGNYAISKTTANSTTSNSILIHIVPLCGYFNISPGINQNLITFWITYTIPGNYTWTMWMVQ